MGKMDFQRILLQAFILHLVLFPCLGLGFGPHKHKINGPIKTIVVLVMENRSFDHMLGWLKSWNDEIDGVTGKESNPLSTTDEDSPIINFSDGSEYVDPDPGHSFQAIREQIFGSEDTSARPAPMNGFAQQAENMSEGMSTHVMRGFRPENLPVYATLATEFALFDKWFASVPTSTQPNRFYVHSATSHGACSNVKINYVAALLLLVMKNEEDAFWMLAVLLENVLFNDCYADNLSGCHVEQRVFKDFLAKMCPSIATHLENINFDVSIVATEWFLCLFAKSLPSETAMRIWDILFNEGANVLFRVALAIFKINEDQLLAANHVGDIIRILRHTTQHAFDPDALLKVAFEKIGSMTTNSITKHCKKQQAAVMAELEQRTRRLNSLERDQP